jgi:hypothetical protein
MNKFTCFPIQVIDPAPNGIISLHFNRTAAQPLICVEAIRIRTIDALVILYDGGIDANAIIARNIDAVDCCPCWWGYAWEVKRHAWV